MTVEQSSLSAPPLYIVVGPTGVGKSKITHLLALRWKTDILVADSRQIYIEMDIGTNKPTQAEQKEVPRHLIDLISPDQFFSVGIYKQKIEAKISEMASIKQNKPIFIEGGTGLYIKALVYGLWEGPCSNWKFRSYLTEQETLKGKGTLHRMLVEIDPLSAQKINSHDLRKIIRALEVYHLTGFPLSEVHARHDRSRLSNAYIVGLRRPRADLYRRIDARVEDQIERGLIEETIRFLSCLAPSLPAMQGLGYRQMSLYLQGRCAREEAIQMLKRDTRHYAKRQMTWFQADRSIEWIDLEENEQTEQAADRVGEMLEGMSRHLGKREAKVGYGQGQPKLHMEDIPVHVGE